MSNENKVYEDENSSVEIFDEESIITLKNEDGEPVSFYEIASIMHKEKLYEILMPAEEIEGIEDDEVVIFEYTTEEGSTDKIFTPLFDEKLVEEVFEIFMRAVSDSETGGCGGCSGCGGGGCGHDHEHEHEHDCECGEDCECGKDCE